jgi:hypothetical protein
MIIGVFPPSRLFWLKATLLSLCGVDIHPTAQLFSSVRIITSGQLTIGAYTYIGHQVLIGGGDASIIIGSNCDIGPRVSIITGDHEFAPTGPRAAGPGFSRPIVIEDGVSDWAACRYLRRQRSYPQYTRWELCNRRGHKFACTQLATELELKQRTSICFRIATCVDLFP